ncbi:MAG: M24 family metallopeptidase [Longicatena sp.]
MAKRIHKMQEFLKANKLDAILLTTKTMKKYIDTLTGGGCKVLITKSNGYLFLDGRYIADAQENEHDLEIILYSPHKSGRSYMESVESLLKKHECKTLGIESSEMKIEDYFQLKELDIELRLLGEQIAMIRIQKEAEEIALMQEAVDITDKIYNKVVKQLKVGMSEYEISALIQYYAVHYGAQQMSFDTIVGSGERSALPHGRPTSRKIQAHEPILMDFGIQYKNYQSDMTRVVFIGNPKPEIEKIYQIVLQAQLAGIKAMKTGVTASDVDKAARDIIEAQGYGAYFDHGLGHGLGIGDGCEYPILNQKGKVILAENMMMSCEPGIYLPGVGGIRIEDDVVIRNGVGVPMNKTTKEIVILAER